MKKAAKRRSNGATKGTKPLAPASGAATLSHRYVAFPLAIFLAAYLLFLVQPLIAKYLLPWFGGSPGVWTTCLLFFQLLLLGGYAYAHLIATRLAPGRQVSLHLVLMLVSLLVLPIIPGEHWKPDDPAYPTWRILGLLAVTVGLPYLVLSTTSPLLQAWFSRARPGASPYRLYALSNAGSLLALLSYPLLIEPLLSRRTQAVAWSVGLGLFVLVGGLCGWVFWRSSRGDGKGVPRQDDGVPGSRPLTPHPGHLPSRGEATGAQSSVRHPRIAWLIYPACASALLLAVTNKICQDIAVVPLLWIVPLGLYLLSFILCFDHPRWYRRTLFGALWFPVLMLAIWAMFRESNGWPIYLQIGIYCLALGLGCMICHGEVARLRPDPRHLTGYYLSISAGGALGGVFVALLAPRLFRTYAEFHLLLAVISLLLVVRWWRDPQSPLYRGRPPVLWAGLVSLLMVAGYVLWTLAELEPANARVLARVRNFYGVLSVYEQPGAGTTPALRVLTHGAVRHGLQFVDPNRRAEPAGYYGPGTGAAVAMGLLPPDSPRHLGVVGLGAGTLAVYARQGDQLDFYEINPVVPELARDYFTYLADTPAAVQVHLGDARLTLEKQSDQAFDVLFLDAFSGDAIPTHLLTRQAFELYLRHLRPRGLLVVHITNHHLDLRPLVLRLGNELGLAGSLLQTGDDAQRTRFATTWLILWRKGEWPVPPLSPAAVPAGAASWTDEHTELLTLLRWRPRPAMGGSQ